MKMNTVYKGQDLKNLQEQVQQDLLCIMDGMDNDFQNDVCDTIVRCFRKFIIEKNGLIEDQDDLPREEYIAILQSVLGIQMDFGVEHLRSGSISPVYATEGEEFQEYAYISTGDIVPNDTLVGYEIMKVATFTFYMLPDIAFANSKK